MLCNLLNLRLVAATILVCGCGKTERPHAVIFQDPTPEEAALIEQAIGGCVVPITSSDGNGTIFFPDADWGLTAAHVVDHVTPDHAIVVSVDGDETELRLRLDAPPGALDEDRETRDDWAVLRSSQSESPIGSCDITLDPARTLNKGSVLFTVGLLQQDFDAYDETGGLRAFRLAVTDPAPGEDASDDLIWMHWPLEYAPRGFSGGPVFARDGDALVVVGINVLSVRSGDRWWLVARRVTHEVVAFAEGE